MNMIVFYLCLTTWPVADVSSEYFYAVSTCCTSIQFVEVSLFKTSTLAYLYFILYLIDYNLKNKFVIIDSSHPIYRGRWQGLANCNGMHSKCCANSCIFISLDKYNGKKNVNMFSKEPQIVYRYVNRCMHFNVITWLIFLCLWMLSLWKTARMLIKGALIY